MKFILGSASDTKKEILEKALKQLHLEPDIRSVRVNSGITDQPLNKSMTKKGARNRANNARRKKSNADFWIGLEGGLHDYGEGYHLVTYACLIFAKGGQGQNDSEFIGSGAEIALPQVISKKIKNDEQFGEVIREYAKNNEVDENLISREVSFIEAIQNAYANYLVSRGDLEYRQKTAAVVVDKENRFLLLQLQGYGAGDWNIPGGGLEEGESPEEGLTRELTEELGTDKFEILEKSKIKNQYEWPDFVIAERIRKKSQYFRGQQQIQFIVRYIGDKSEIKPQEEEIRKTKWVDYKDLKSHLLFPGQWENIEEVIKSSSLKL